MHVNGVGRSLVWSCALGALVLALGAAPRRAVGEVESQLVVVFDSGVRPFAEAVEGLRAGLGKMQVPVLVDLRSTSADAELSDALRRKSPRLLIAVGREALNRTAAHNSPLPILATMILRSDSAATAGASSTPPRVSAVYLDVPVADVMVELNAAFPGKDRLGVIWNPSQHGRSVMRWRERARQQGFALHVVECSSPEDLLKGFLSLKAKADFVLMLPDSSLYNDATIRPLILASLEHRLPIIGFSASFVRAGAALGVYPDFRDIGAQTAEAALRHLAAPAGPGEEGPRKLVVAVNQRVARLLGLEHQTPPNHAVVTIR